MSLLTTLQQEISNFAASLNDLLDLVGPHTNMSLYVALLITMGLSTGFFILAYQSGTLSSFGRRALPWKHLGFISLAGCVPFAAFMGTMLLCSLLGPVVVVWKMIVTFSAYSSALYLLQVKLIKIGKTFRPWVQEQQRLEEAKGSKWDYWQDEDKK